MSGTRLTGSRFELAETCEGALALEPSRDAGDPYANRGKAIHNFIDEARRFGRAVALERVPEKWRDECGSLDLEELGTFLGGWETSDFETEVALAFNVTTGESRRIPTTAGRIIGEVAVDEVPAVIDAARWLVGRAVVIDWKTGFKMVDTPATNPQPRFYALAAARLVSPEERRSSDNAEAGIVQFGEDGEEPTFRRASYDDLELAAIAGYVRVVWQKDRRAKELVAEGKANKLRYVEGSHCKRCPALPRCPAIARSAQALVELNERTAYRPAKDPDAEPIPVLTDDQAVRGWMLYKALSAAVDRAERALKLYVLRRGGIHLPTGKVVRALTYDQDVLDADKVWLLADELGIDTAAIVKELKVSKAGLARALGKKEAKEFLEKLAERPGAIRQAERTKYDEVKP